MFDLFLAENFLFTETSVFFFVICLLYIQSMVAWDLVRLSLDGVHQLYPGFGWMSDKVKPGTGSRVRQ